MTARKPSDINYILQGAAALSKIAATRFNGYFFMAFLEAFP
jgi:hypothetical protein